MFKKARGYWLHDLLLLPSIAKHNLSIQGLASKTKITYLVFIWYDLLTSLMVISIYWISKTPIKVMLLFNRGLED